MTLSIFPEHAVINAPKPSILALLRIHLLDD
jgi:hypothetical protein